MVSDAGFVGTLQADFGLGKTYCADKVEELLIDSGARKDEIFRYSGLELDDGTEFIAWLDKRLDEELKPSMGTRIKRIFSFAAAAKIARGIIGDGAALLKTQKTADAVADVMGVGLSNVNKPSDSERLATRIRALKVRLQRSQQRYYLVVDDIQKTSSNANRALRELIQMQAPNVRIFLTWDPKRYLKRESADLRSLKTELQKNHAGANSYLSKLTGKEIGLWYAEKAKLSLSAADEALAAEISDGSPTVIKSWLESGSRKVVDIAAHTNRVWGQYEESFESLSNNAKSIISLLACSEMSVRISWLAESYSLKAADLDVVLRELGDLDLVVSNRDRIKCKDKNWIDFLRGKLSDTELSVNRIRLMPEEFSSIRGYSREEARMKNVVQLISSSQNGDKDDIEALLAEIHKFLHNGYYEMAERIFASLPYNDLVEHWIPAYKIRYATLKSDLAGEYGEYRDAIEWAEKGLSFCETETQKIVLQIEIGDKYLQQAIHDKALTNFRAARKAAEKISDLNAVVKSAVRTLKLAFDRERYETCRRIADRLLENLDSEELTPKNRCLGHRWMARIYAVNPANQNDRDQALYYARTAREIAVSENNPRDIANCDFVLGEVYRQSKQVDAAMGAYRQALDAARDSGNKDLEAYSLLGICVLYASESDWEKVLIYLEELELCLKYHAPVEMAYFELLSTAVTAKTKGAIDQAILDKQLGNLWALKKRRHTGALEMKSDPNFDHTRVLQKITWAFPL